MFDEEIDTLGGGGRRNNFTDWLVALLICISFNVILMEQYWLRVIIIIIIGFLINVQV